MDISQISNTLQNDQLQGVMDFLDPSDSSNSSDPFSDLLQSTQTSSAADSTATAGNLAMLQALQGANVNPSLIQSLLSSDGTTASDPDLSALDGTDTTDPLLQYMDGLDGTDSTDPLDQYLDSLDGTNATDPLLQYMNGATGSSATAQNNDLAMLLALNNSNSNLLQAELGNSSISAGLSL